MWHHCQTMQFCNHISLLLVTWWRHQMETFSALLAICAGNSPVSGELPAQRPVTRSFDVFFDRRLNKRLSKQWWDWWFETLSGPLCRHWNELKIILTIRSRFCDICHNKLFKLTFFGNWRVICGTIYKFDNTINAVWPSTIHVQF